MYATLYPADVVGVVLVDSADTDLSLMVSKSKNSRALRQFWTDVGRRLDMHGYVMPFGIPRLMGWCGDEPISRALYCQVKWYREIHEERADFFGQDEEQMRSTGSLANMPLVVLSRDPERLWISPMGGMTAELEKEFNQMHEKMQQELPSLSSNSSRIIAKGSGHYIQLDHPDVVIEAVHKVVDQSRQRQAGSAKAGDDSANP